MGTGFGFPIIGREVATLTKEPADTNSRFFRFQGLCLSLFLRFLPFQSVGIRADRWSV